MMDTSISHADITYRIIGAAMRVHRRTPRGLYERHYQKALTAELIASGLTAPEEYHTEIYDGGVWLGRLYLDHWVNEAVVVELKAVSHPTGNVEVAQVIAYLSAMGAKVGLLINFGQSRLEYRRILPPKSTEGWQTHIAKYLWRPNANGTPTDNTPGPVNPGSR